MSRSTPISLYGYGCVGRGFTHILEKNGRVPSCIAVHDATKERDRPCVQSRLPDKAEGLIIEATSDHEFATRLIQRALKDGASVASASKKAIATSLETIVRTAAQSKGSIRYEAAVCASIPVIHLLESQFADERIKEIHGVLNGTSNYILSKLFYDRVGFRHALAEAQKAGFAEADPSSDVEAWDASYKLAILILHAFGSLVEPQGIIRNGISRISDQDIAFARLQGWTIKNVAAAWEINGDLNAYVLPQFVRPDEALFDIGDEQNSVCVRTEFSGTHHWVGPGAGSLPTGQALYSDTRNLQRGSGYEFHKFREGVGPRLRDNDLIGVYVRFASVGAIDTSTFSDLHDIGEFQGVQYALGTVFLNDLRISDWLVDPHKQVVVLPSRKSDILLN